MRTVAMILWAFLILTASAGALGYYAINSAPDRVIGCIYLLAVAALLSAEFALPHLARARWRAREWGSAAIMTGALTTAMAVVVALDIGFMALVSDHGRAGKALDAARNKAVLEAAEKPQRPVGVIRADVADAERRNPGIRREWCHDAKNAARREACMEWSTLRGELETAEAVAALKVQGGTETDARASLIARWLGGHWKAWSDFLAFLGALALSLCRIALSLAMFPTEQTSARVHTPKSRKASRPTIATEANAPAGEPPAKLSRGQLLRFTRGAQAA